MTLARLDYSLPAQRIEKFRPFAVEDPATGCWIWTRSKTGNGYGRVRMHKQQYAMHRVFYTALVGSVPMDKVLDHLCRQRACVNPAHLEVVTEQVNFVRGCVATGRIDPRRAADVLARPVHYREMSANVVGVCMHCGVSVRPTPSGSGLCHAANGYTRGRSCGRKPLLSAA